MRDFIISMILFSILIVVVIGNSIYINNEVKLLCAAVRNVPDIESPDCQPSIDSLRDEWQDFKKAARFSLNYNEINKMDCLIEELDCHLATQNVNDFEHAKVMMMNLLNEIVRLEKITVDGIF